MEATTIRRETGSPEETREVGRRLGAALQAGDLVTLDGELGAGKTCLVQGVAEGMGVGGGPARSPTFVFHHVHPGSVPLHHIDLYRLGAGADVGFLDLDDLLFDGAVLIEWGGYAQLGRYQPLAIDIEIGRGDARTIRARGGRPGLADAL